MFSVVVVVVVRALLLFSTTTPGLTAQPSIMSVFLTAKGFPAHPFHKERFTPAWCCLCWKIGVKCSELWFWTVCLVSAEHPTSCSFLFFSLWLVLKAQKLCLWVHRLKGITVCVFAHYLKGDGCSDLLKKVHCSVLICLSCVLWKVWYMYDNEV